MNTSPSLVSLMARTDCVADACCPATVGDKWSTFQTINFENNSQPYYVLMDANFKLLNQPVGYTPDAEEFLQWLEDGKSNYIKPIN